MGHVVVTGANGFIGSNVVRQLLAAGRKVIAVVEPNADVTNLDGIDVERVAADVNDAAAFDRVLSGAEALHHLAAIYRIWLPDPELIYRVNVEGTTSVLLSALKQKVKRIVYTSSIAAIGMRPDGQPADESIPFNMFGFANEYLLTKYLSERVAQRFADSGAPVVMVNPAFPFGERDRAPTPTGKILLGVVKGKTPGYSAGGFNAVDVDIVAQGHLLAEEKGRVGQRYILGDHNITFRDFFRLISEEAGIKFADREIPVPVALAIGWAMEEVANRFTHKHPLTTYKAMQYGTKNSFFDVTKARTELGLPSRPLRETVQKSIRWYQENGFLRPTKGESRADRSGASANA